MAGKNFEKKVIAIKADVGKFAGLGHLRRCMALAVELQNLNARIFFILKKDIESLNFAKNAGFEAMAINPKNESDDLNRTVEILKKRNAGTVIVDSYTMPGKNFRELAEKFNLIKITDFNQGNGFAKIVVNGNIHAKLPAISRHSVQKFLFGSKYFLLNKEFREKKRKKRVFGLKKLKIVVSLGGSDPKNLTLTSLKALNELNAKAIVTIILGPNFKFEKTIGFFLKNFRHSAKVLKNCKNMPEILSQNDIAIVGASNTAYESIYLGLPTIALAQSQNQKLVAKGLNSKNVAIGLEKPSVAKIAGAVEKILADEKLRNSFFKNSLKEIDGKGAQRAAVQVIKSLNQKN